MKHSIFVTVEEFKANGGTMKSSMALYKQTEYLTYELVGWYNFDVQTFLPYTIIISQSDRTFQLDTENVYVKIQCTPIYE